MRILIETGILIDYLARGQYAVLRKAHRSGRDPQALYSDAQNLLDLVATSPVEGTISALTFYEAEEALYREISPSIKAVPNAEALRLAVCRPILNQALTAAQLFNLRILELSENAVMAVPSLPLLAEKGVRAADSLHVTTAANHDVDVIVSADSDIKQLDMLVANGKRSKMRCVDSDVALALLRSSISDSF
ncbi:PIN domain-containing protein [Roseomonas stagni]|uniref:PIN domain-containing protein n=1 Tax=Falsiroseomonas algicola TaxID=2716930 RepID=A0A6M1LUA7_9PROT|nr:PIN domain-containing protein [Falsiroseomonas algicola]NGM24050.1 PIN domain-containing protein [Falsiroseomonas algicola]